MVLRVDWPFSFIWTNIFTDNLECIQVSSKKRRLEEEMEDIKQIMVVKPNKKALQEHTQKTTC